MPLQFTPRRTKTPPRFPNRIREYRIRAGLTQRRLAEQLGLDPGLVSLWECGRILPTLPNVLRLAKLLDTLAESLYQGFYTTAPAKSENQRQP